MLLESHVADTLEHSSAFIFAPTNEAEYARLVQLLDELSDVVRDDEAHPLAKTMDVAGILIADYEEATVPEPDGDPIGVLKYFMACLLYTSPSPRDLSTSRMPSSA